MTHCVYTRRGEAQWTQAAASPPFPFPLSLRKQKETARLRGSWRPRAGKFRAPPARALWAPGRSSRRGETGAGCQLGVPALHATWGPGTPTGFSFDLRYGHSGIRGCQIGRARRGRPCPRPPSQSPELESLPQSASTRARVGPGVSTPRHQVFFFFWHPSGVGNTDSGRGLSA